MGCFQLWHNGFVSLGAMLQWTPLPTEAEKECGLEQQPQTAPPNQDSCPYVMTTPAILCAYVCMHLKYV